MIYRESLESNHIIQKEEYNVNINNIFYVSQSYFQVFRDKDQIMMFDIVYTIS